MYFVAIIALVLILKEALAIDSGPYILHFHCHLRYYNLGLYFIISNAFLIYLAEGSGGYENKTNSF